MICINEIHSVVLVCTKSDGRVVHSYGRLIPHEFPITDLQQISGPDGIGRIACTVSSGTARFAASGGQLEADRVTQPGNGNTPTAALVVNTTNVDSFTNRGLYCNNFDHFFYLFLSSKRKYIKQYTTTWHIPIAECELNASGTESSSPFDGSIDHRG